MDKLNIDLENCYGINKLTQEFDFTKSNTVIIYASNGVMKTSFANTFKDVSSAKTPKDRLFGKPTSYTIKIDNINDIDELKDAINLALSDFIELHIKGEPIINICPKVIIVSQKELLQFVDIDSIKNSFNFFAL